MEVNPKEDPMAFRILSFCGGGLRGVLSATILQRLWAEVSDVVSRADMLAGTSTGTDIMSQILANKQPPEIVDSYVNGGSKLMGKPSDDPHAPAYPIEELVAAQRILHPKNPLLSSIAKPALLFTTFNVGNATTDWKPLLFTNFQNVSASGQRDVPLVDAIVSSSAMPGMYGSHRGNIDGAFVSHDPTLAAISLAVANGHKLEDITAICFGTGFMGNRLAADTARWGAHQWMHGVPDPLNHAPPLLINGTHSPILNASMNGTSTHLTQDLSGLLLGPRYVYLDARLDHYVAENDVKAIPYLIRAGNDVPIGPAIELLNRYWM